MLSKYWTFYNPHPKKKLVPDCVKRTVCRVTGMEYMAVQRMLNRIKREIGAESFKSKSVGIELARRNGWEHIECQTDGETFCKEHPTGKYILQMPRHWVACVNGMLYDTWDTTSQEVTEAWIVEE